MYEEMVRVSREQVANTLGAALASKATDAFCLAFIHPTTVTAEAAQAPFGTGLVILELASEPPPPVPLRVAVENMRQSVGWQDAVQATGSALRASLASRSAQRVNASLNPTALIREFYVRELRERCYRAAGAVRDELEREAAKFLSLLPERGSPTSPHTQYCWINQTIRTWIDPRKLASLAGDPAIKTVDVPQDLEFEASVSGKVVGCTQHRERTSTSGRGVIVAVIDTEIDRNHPAFDDRVYNMGNYSHQDWGNPRLHGTRVAGIIAARDNVHSGMAPDALIYSYKVTPRFSGEDFFAACALQQALEDGAHIANLSWGSKAKPDGRSRLVLACNQAWACGMTIVKSAGNKGENPQTISSPADAEGIIVVGATDRKGVGVLRNSSRGPAENGKSCPDMVAPGGDESNEIITCNSSDGFSRSGEGGTSLAAAHVSGLLCLLLESEPDSTPDELRERLFSLCKKFPDGDDNTQGRGLVSLANLP
jgi:serine protease AprX